MSGHPMHGPPKEQADPAGEGGTGSKVIVGNGDTSTIADSDDQVRCSRCGAALSAESSVRRELGPICLRIALAELGARWSV